MKIAFITLGFEPVVYSGLDVSGSRLINKLIENGHHVTVISGVKEPIIESIENPLLEIHRIPIGISDWIGFSYRAARLLESLNKYHNFDVVHFWDIHFAYAYSGKFIGSLHQSFRQRIKSLNWKMSNPLSLFYKLSYYFLAIGLAEKPAIHKSSGLLAVSATTRDEFIRNYDIQPSKIVLARHGIDTKFFKKNDNTISLRSALGISAGELVIMFTGFITPRKGLEFLAEAFSMIEPSPHLIIGGKWRDNKYREKIFKIFGSKSSKVIEPGYIPINLLPTYYSMADVYVSPSLLEGFGLPLAEVLACETPVVATDAGSSAEVVGPGGILVPPRNPKALADAISYLLNNNSLRHELGKKGRDYIVNNFSLKTMVKAVLDAYKYFK